MKASAKPASDWSYPAPHAGWRGYWDRLVGPGATTAESGLSVAVGLCAVVGVAAYATIHQLGWSWLSHAVAALIVLDVVGGAVVNATTSAKRWYHRAGQGFRQHFGFLALHGLHIAAVAGLFSSAPLLYAVTAYGYVLLTGLATLRAPLRMQRPVAQSAVCGAILLAAWGLPEAPAWEWFLPVLVIKLIVGHATLESPFVTEVAVNR
ncbi:hypothetical protein QWY84_02775 [Aquisalimonas lutea]|uniref:hypothetical protein n=1 Tax=Aquisalimonas lutea TaxID=1327750 RepID=UPI0025B3AC56|nr:hypothetical protein [Aquisalimonas lutea]MDN3516525.1 hypothetical protein [Aquisalimonas lutea]